MIRELTEKDVEFTVEALPEDTPIKGNAMASGDDKVDARAERWIERQLDSGNEWAWCCVRVTAKWKGFEGVDYLGCCSYKSERDFKRGGYWKDMKAQALDDLNRQLAPIGELCR